MTQFWRRQAAPTTGIFPPVPLPSGGVPYFPQILPPGSLVGRLATLTGPTEAISFDQLARALQPFLPTAGSVTQLITSGDVSVTAADRVIVINKAVPAATAVALCSASAFTGAALEIYDWGGNAGDITLTPAGGETIMGQSTWTLTSNGAGMGGSLRLLPSVRAGVVGWVVR